MPCIPQRLAAQRSVFPPTGSLAHRDHRLPEGAAAVMSAAKAEARSSPITIVISDHHWVVRAGVRLLLDAEDGFQVVAEAGDLTTTERRLFAHHPRVLVLDLNMPDEPGLAAIPRIRRSSPETRIVVLTMDEDPQLARAALDAGATCYALKQAPATDLIHAVRLAADGLTYLDPHLAAGHAAKPRSPDRPPDDLTTREIEVLRLIALGHTGPEIATQLQCSLHTVQGHRAHILQKTRRTKLPDLVAYAQEHQLL